MSHQFYPGQKVVTVLRMPRYPQFPVGSVFTVRDISTCHCGVNLDVGLSLTKPGASFCYCTSCGHQWHGQTAWGHERGFRPFDELDAVIEEIEAMEAPVELETVEA